MRKFIVEKQVVRTVNGKNSKVRKKKQKET
jgi:hypothetical protein